MWSKHDSKDDAGNMISSETSQTEVWIDPGFEAAAMHVCQRFEDNADRDTGSPRNVSPPLPVQCSSPGFISSEVRHCLGKYPSKSCFSKPAAREGSPVSLVLNSCCAHCDKIERGIERDRLHNQPVFHNAEPNLPAATLFEIWIWIHQVQIQINWVSWVPLSV